MEPGDIWPTANLQIDEASSKSRPALCYFDWVLKIIYPSSLQLYEEYRKTTN